MVLISLAIVKDPTANATSYASSPCQSLMAGVATNAKKINAKSSDDEEI